jgi:hypothetical protein
VKNSCGMGLGAGGEWGFLADSDFIRFFLSWPLAPAAASCMGAIGLGCRRGSSSSLSML